MEKIIEYFLSLPKTIFFNLYYFPFREAIHLPLVVNYKTLIGGMGSRTSVTVSSSARVFIGWNGSFALGRNETYWYVSENAKIHFGGGCYISKGTQIICDGQLNIGKDFYCNANCIINAGKRISIGDCVLLGWGVTILDGDGHIIKPEKGISNKYDSIIINDHVWIASEATVLKGSIVSKDSVIAYGSVVSKKYEEEKLLIGEFNKILKKNITWEK